MLEQIHILDGSQGDGKLQSIWDRKVVHVLLLSYLALLWDLFEDNFQFVKFDVGQWVKKFIEVSLYLRSLLFKSLKTLGGVVDGMSNASPSSTTSIDLWGGLQ